MTFFRLVKAGYARSLREAESMDARSVIQALAYETFLSQYQMTMTELNKPKG